MRFSLSALPLCVLLLFVYVSRCWALTNSATVADATIHLPPPHQNAVTTSCTDPTCGTMKVSGLASDGGWTPLANATIAIQVPNGMKGFLIYASAPNGKHVGQFTVTKGVAQLFDDATPPGSTLQHVDNRVQNTLQATWTAPPNDGIPSDLVFTALVLETISKGYILQQTIPQSGLSLAAVPSVPSPDSYMGNKNVIDAAAAAAAPVVNCFITVPANPLTAAGLATPYILSTDKTGNTPCTMANTGSQAFVQGAVIDTATGAISIYNPLVIDMGTKPAVVPTAPTLPAKNVVALWFGFNGNNLTLKNAAGTNSVTQGKCVNGVAGSTFTQFAYCNAPAFFNAVQNAVENGKIATAANAAAVTKATGKAPTVVVPALGNAADGKPCPTLRDFFFVDMDQSDNLDVTYLITKNGQVAQNTAANAKALAGAVTAVNPGDNALLTMFVNPAIKCAPGLQAPDLANNGAMVSALPLSELQANLLQGFPQARVPALDPMVLVNNAQNMKKLNNFRVGVMQFPVKTLNQANTACYCKNMAKVAPARLQALSKLLALSNSFVAGQNLFQFLVTRFNAAVGAGGLNCAQFGVKTAFTVTNPQFMPVSKDHPEYSHFKSAALAAQTESLYEWHRIPGSQGLIRMHVLDSNNQTTTVTVDTNMIDSYAKLDMTSTLENMDHNNALGLEMDQFASLNLIEGVITDPGTENAGDNTDTPFIQTGAGIGIIIGVSVAAVAVIIGAGSYCYIKRRKSHSNTVSTMSMSQM